MRFVAAFLAAATLLLLKPAYVNAQCHPIEVTWYSPTGVAGCETYGTGLASWWQGPGVARNDCLWPWTNCQPIRITSRSTGLSVTVTPTMYGDLYTGTPDERLVDLDPATLKALGLWENRSRGLFPVTVTPATALPDTAMSDGPRQVPRVPKLVYHR